MSIDTLLLAFSMPETSISENNNKVFMDPERNERVLFFDISKQHVSKSVLRRDWNMSDDEKMCDGIVLYIRGEKKVFCLLELKGGAIERAIEQVEHTKDVMMKSVKCKLCGQVCSHIIWTAYIRPTGNSPISPKAQDKMNRIFYKGNISRDPDIGKFLRKI